MEEKLTNKLTIWSGYLLLILSLASVSFTKYIPSLDGLQHLHTIHVLAEIIKGNNFINQFYEVNPIPVGYWSAHFIIGFFHLYLPSWAAEKAYLFVYIIGMFLSFRFLVNRISYKKANAATLLIFPFMYSSYQLLGYHTFSFAAIFYFLGIGVLLKLKNKNSLKNLILFSLITLGQFFSHALVFAFFLMSVGVILLGILIRKEQDFKEWLLNTCKIFLAIIPSLVLWINYIISVMHLDNTILNASLTFVEQLKEFIRIRLLVGFSHHQESYGYRILFVLIAFLTITIGWQFIKSRKTWSFRFIIETLFKEGNVFLILSLLFLGLYFFAPNKISAGNLTNRYGLYFFYNLIVWLSVKSFNHKLNILIIISVISIFIYTRQIHIKHYLLNQKTIIELKEVEQQILPNSLIYHTHISQSWLDKHYPLYVGTDISVVNVRNPQCWGHFPVVWNFDSMPNLMMGKSIKTPKIKGIETQNIQVDTITYQLVERS